MSNKGFSGFFAPKEKGWYNTFHMCWASLCYFCIFSAVKAEGAVLPSNYARFFYTTNVCALYGQVDACKTFEQDLHWYAQKKSLPWFEQGAIQETQAYAQAFMRRQWQGSHERFPLQKERLYFQTLTLLGSKAAEQGDYPKAARYLLCSEIMAKEVYWPYFEGLMHNHLGILYYSERAYEKAAYHFHAALRNILQSNEGWDEPHWTQNILNNIGLCYYKQNQPAPALASFHRAFQVAYHAEDKSGVAFSYINWVHAVWAFSPQKLSTQMVLRMQRFAAQSGYPIFMGRAKVVGAMVYDAMGQTPSADQMLQGMNPEVYLFREYRYQRYYYLLLAKLAKQQGDFKSAYVYTLKESEASEAMDQIYQAKFLQLERVKQDMAEAANSAQSIRHHIQAKGLQGQLWFVFGLLLFVVVVVISLLWLSLRKRYAKFIMVSKGLQKKNQEQHQTHRQLELANKQKSYILGTVAHDLRHVLGNVTQVSDLLLATSAGKLYTKENQHLMHLLGHSAKMGLFTLQDLSDAMRPDHQMPILLGRMLPQQLIEEVQKLLFSKLVRKKITIKVDNEAPFLMACDHDQALRAITNVLDNAIKFSEPGSSIHIVLCQTAGQSTLIRIRDFGKGISVDLRPTLFRPFSRGSRGTLGETSTGLGLFIVKKIMRAHGGKVWAKTTLGKGTAFYLSFPPIKTPRSMGQI